MVDDELVARRRLVRLLAAMPDVELAGECETAEDALRAVRDGGIDVLLLDIQMPGLSGVEALGLLEGIESPPQVVLCTAHPDFALPAFDGGAVDYLLKPIEAGRLAKAMARVSGPRGARARRRPEPPAPTALDPAPLPRLAIPTPRGIVLVSPRDVSHAVLENEVVTVHLADGGSHFTDLSLQDLQEKLPASFFRGHRRLLLNLDRVSRLEPVESGGFRAQMANGHGVTLSRQAARELRRLLGLSRGADDGEA